MNSLGARVSAAAAATLVIVGPICRAQSIEAHEVGTGTGQVSHWETSWGSYNRDFHETKNIRIFVRDVSRSLKNVEVRVYFTALKSGGERFIYNHATLQVPLNGQVEVSDEIAAPPLFSNELHLVLANRHYSSGAHMEGWMRLGAMIHAFLKWLLPIKVCLGLHKTVRSISSLLKPEFTKENQHRLQRPRYQRLPTQPIHLPHPGHLPPLLVQWSNL